MADPPNPRRKSKLLQYLTTNHSALCPSNKSARRLLSTKRVYVNGVMTTSAALKVDDNSSVVIMDASATDMSTPPTPPDSLLIAFHKPCGMLTSSTPPSASAPFTLQSIYPPIPPHYHPVGRLDMHSRGLLLFSKDSRLTWFLLSPTSKIARTYELVVETSERIQSPRSLIETVAQGVSTKYGLYSGDVTEVVPLPKDYVCPRGLYDASSPDRASRRSDRDVTDLEHAARAGGGEKLLYKVTVAVDEGKKRMVRRLFAHLNLHVVDLCRVNYGSIGLGHLKAGEFRVVGAGGVEGGFVARCLEGGK